MRFFTTVYLLLLGYIIVALVFWELSLQKQSHRIYEMEVEHLRKDIDSAKTPILYNEQQKVVETNLDKRTKQYIGEGATFLIVILIGAAVVYESFRRSVKLSRQQNNFMLSVTHELKSPIAGIKLNLQTMQKHKLDEEKQALLIGRCVKESDRLNDLCSNILFASRLEGRQYKPAKEEIDFSDLADQCFSEFNNRYLDRFEENIEPDCIINGDRIMLQVTINNLLENAIKYTPTNTKIVVSLIKKVNSVVFCVADEGSGIPDEEKKKVFSKFYRLGNEESRKTKGTGLGLYLTAKVVKQHKGQITIKDNKPRGCIFEVVLPVG